jgi:anaerobic nitric oxide reductase transcription regulator
VLLLAGYFLEKTSRKLGIRQLRLTQDAELALRSYHWPGNVRELEHVISRASLKAKAKPTTTGIVSLNREFLELPATASGENSVVKPAELKSLLPSSMDLKTATNEFQKQCILIAITQADGNWSEAARSLKIDRANLIRMAKRLGISIKKSVINHQPI